MLVAVLEEQHVTRAAERLGVPQPTVSAAMHRFAEAIGTPLVQQSGRGITVTAAGQALLPSAKEALTNLRAAFSELQDVVDPDRGRVALGFAHSRGPHDVPALIDAFLAAYPDVSFTLKQGGPALLDQMLAGDLDIVIVSPMPPPDDRLESVVLGDERLYLTVAPGHPLANRAFTELRDAAAETFVASPPGHGLRYVFEDICEQAGFIPHVAFEGEEHATMRGLIRAGLGIAVLPKPAHHDDTVVNVHLRDPHAHRHVGAVWPKDRRLPPAARRFVSFLRTSGAEVLRRPR
jgi:DNA-binding transcriptional LysR family regulator